MKIVLLIVAFFIVLIAVMIAIGAMLPRHHTASRSAFIAKPPSDVYAAVRAGVQPAERLDDRHFKQEGVTYEIVEEKPAERYVTRIADTNLGYGGSWSWQFAPENGGTRVTITEDGEVTNLFFRFMARFVFGYTSTMEKALAALAAKCGTTPPPSADPTPAR